MSGSTVKAEGFVVAHPYAGSPPQGCPMQKETKPSKSLQLCQVDTVCVCLLVLCCLQCIPITPSAITPCIAITKQILFFIVLMYFDLSSQVHHYHHQSVPCTRHPPRPRLRAQPPQQPQLQTRQGQHIRIDRAYEFVECPMKAANREKFVSDIDIANMVRKAAKILLHALCIILTTM